MLKYHTLNMLKYHCVAFEGFVLYAGGVYALYPNVM